MIVEVETSSRSLSSVKYAFIIVVTMPERIRKLINIIRVKVNKYFTNVLFNIIPLLSRS